LSAWLLAAVAARIYMALNKINAVPLMHLLCARTFLEGIVAVGYIAMRAALLIT